MTLTGQTTIGDALARFLAEQRERLSERTFRNYDYVIDLLRDSLDRYAYSSLDDIERSRLRLRVLVPAANALVAVIVAVSALAGGATALSDAIATEQAAAIAAAFSGLADSEGDMYLESTVG